jgi:hypothetical protein
MPTKELIPVETTELKPGTYFKQDKKWYLADSVATERADSTPNFRYYRIYAYGTDGIRTMLDYVSPAVETIKGNQRPEVFSGARLAAHARKLETDASNLLRRVASIRQFAAKLESQEV